MPAALLHHGEAAPMGTELGHNEIELAADWEAPSVLPCGGTLPPFPLEALPGWLADHVSALSVFTQTPLDLPGAVALAALSTALGGRVVVEVRPGWREPVNLYVVIALPPGSRKSAVFAELTAPILEAERTLVAKIAPEILEAKAQLRIAERKADAAAHEAAKAKPADSQQLKADAIGAAQMAAGVEVPTEPRLVADDVTVEAAASLLASQGGRLAVLSAEGGIFGTLAGRYSGGAPNLEVFLKGHAGDMMRVDRKGRPAEHVQRPALTLGLAVQPEVLREIAKMPGFRGRGLLARILYSLPRNTVGSRDIDAPIVPAEVREEYARSLRYLVTEFAGWTDPAVLVLAPNSRELLRTFERELEPKLAEGAALSHVVDWASKLSGAAVRIAGLLHVAGEYRSGWAKPISEETMAAGLMLARYFTAHALEVFDAMSSDPRVEGAAALLAWIQRNGKPVFSTREAMTGVARSRFPKVADLEIALGMLVDHGYIRSLEPEPREGRGRPPGPKWEVNPYAAVYANTQKATSADYAEHAATSFASGSGHLASPDCRCAACSAARWRQL